MSREERLKRVRCYRCQRMGHYANRCRETTKQDGSPIDAGEGAAHMQQGKAEPSESAEPEEFNFEDELEYDDSINAYMFLQDAKIGTCVENMSGNSRYCLNMKHADDRLNNFWVLLDNQSTVHIFSNPMLLSNIRKSKGTLTLHTNTGTAEINEEGDFPGVGPVWFYRKGIANILSFHGLEQNNKFEIDYSTRPDSQGVRDKSFRVETPDGVHRRFQPDGKGLYFLDCTVYYGAGKPNSVFGRKTATGNSFATNGDIHPTDTLPSVSANKAKFTDRDVKRADNVRRFQHVAAHPSDETLRLAASNRTINNMPFTPKDIRIARAVYGPSIYGIQGKRTHRTKDTVETDAIVPVPRSVSDFYQEVTLSADILHVNQIPFLGTVSRHIHYGTVSPLPSMKLTTLGNALLGVIRSYAHRGFVVKHIMVDMQFAGLQSEFQQEQVAVNPTSFKEHSPEIERYIRTIKERARACYAMLPFKRLPKKIVVALLQHVVFYLNAFPWPGGVSQTLSPMTLVEGILLDFTKHFHVIFGEYAHVYTGTDNTMTSRSVGAIALGPVGNLQGGVKFFSLQTGEILSRHPHDFALLPMPTDAVTRVNRMARHARAGLHFGNRLDDALPDSSDDDDDDYTPPEVATDITLDSSADDASHHDDEASTGVDEQGNESTDESSHESGSDSEHESDSDSDDEEDDDDGGTPGVPIPGVQLPGVHDPTVETVGEDDPDDDDDSYHPIRTASGRVVKSNRDDDFVYTSWGHKAEDYLFGPNHLETVHEEQAELTREKIQRLHGEEYQNFIRGLEYIERSQEYHDFVNEYTMAQLNIKEGLKQFGMEGKASLMKEINNLVSRDCFGEVEYESLTSEQKRNALPILMFMVKKRDGRIKSRGCADGRRQRLWTEKQDVSSPTPAVEALKYILSVISLEGRDVASFDLPAQFLQTDMDELLHLKVSGALALLLVESDPERWSKHLRKENGKPVIYLICNKAIYGTLNAAILAYKRLTGYFQDWGFEMNPYDPCVWNRTIDGTQMTVIFHVDDGLASHLNPKRVTEFLQKLDAIYGKTDPLTITRGKHHEYLGMTLDFSTPGQVCITMYDYVQKLINKLPKDMIGERATAAPEYLFKSTGSIEARKLDPARAEEFHMLTATTLYLSLRTRVDLQLGVGFLCTRVKSPDEHDWKKLAHLMQYLQKTRHLPLVLRSEGTGSVIYMDGSHAVHADMKGHAGVYATEGKGAMYSSSTKLKSNTLSSTETELVTVGEKLPKCLWFRLFRIAQGGYANEDVLMQDNQSTIQLVNNGRYSAGKGSKHIEIRYFFVTDRIQKKHIKVQYCPTEEMIADFFTKPLQGALFYKFRDAVLGIDAQDFDEYKRKYYETLKRFQVEDEFGRTDFSEVK